MKIGYPCINTAIGCTCSRTFRLASYSDQRMQEIIAANLSCLDKTLAYNIAHGLLFFRITSDLVPFASHEVCTFSWQKHFKRELARLGRIIREAGMRISMHPDQFVLLNSPEMRIVEASIAELAYHCEVLDLMELDPTAKVQIHVGGVYNDKQAAIGRFVERYQGLPETIRRRLVIENDDRLFSVVDCLQVHAHTGVPILFDAFHHECLNHGEATADAFAACAKTWKQPDGVPMIDYSSQAPGERKGKHTDHIDLEHFRGTLLHLGECDIMLEIKDKQVSALQALEALSIATPASRR